ncbi:MAG: hypothetical protein ACP5GA_09510 [Acidithiobacillus sp.]
MPSASPEKNRQDAARFRAKMQREGYRQIHVWVRLDQQETLLKRATVAHQTLSEAVQDMLDQACRATPVEQAD